MSEAIPSSVLDALEFVRAGGETNMLAMFRVIELAEEVAYSSDEEDAIEWLEDNKGRYMEALKAMGARR